MLKSGSINLGVPLDMRQLLDVETFRDVVGFARKRNPAASEVEVVHALNYYREKDDFYDLEH